MKAPMYTTHAGDYEMAILNNVYNAHYERPSMLSMLPDLKGKSVIDLGCGPGVYTEHFIDSGAEVTACDVSTEMIEIVKRKFGSQVNSYCADLSGGLPREKSSSFDIAVSSLAIHYIQDLSCLFRDVARVLKNDGSFIFSTHHPMVDYQSSPSGNYYSRELLKQDWNTTGNPVSVQFYRRSLTELFGAIPSAGMCVASLSEGSPSEVLKEIAPESYERLSRKPAFLFIQCCRNAAVNSA